MISKNSACLILSIPHGMNYRAKMKKKIWTFGSNKKITNHNKHLKYIAYDFLTIIFLYFKVNFAYSLKNAKAIY